MEQLEGYVEKGREDCVCFLKKSFYGLKQSFRQWNLKFNAFMSEIGFIRSDHDQCVYVNHNVEYI